MKNIPLLAAAAAILIAAMPAAAGGMGRHPAFHGQHHHGHHPGHFQGHGRGDHAWHGRSQSFTLEPRFAQGHVASLAHTHPAWNPHVYRYDYPGYPVYVWRPHTVFQSGGSTILIIR